MKKILAIASVIITACAVNAATFTWGLTSIDTVDINGNYMGEAVPGYAYLFLGTVTASDTAFDMTGTTLLASGGQNDDFTYGSLVDLKSSSDLASDAAGQAFSIILFENEVSDFSKFEGNYLIATGSSTQGNNPMTGDTWANFQNGTDFASSDWKTMSNVPEPTSGLLLLIGMAGLALKRKNA